MNYLWLLLCLIFGCSVCGQAQPPLVVILLPGTNLHDWQSAEAPNLHRLMLSGALAVMNTRTARLPNAHRRETAESAALTLGAGARAAGGLEAGTFQPSSTLVAGLVRTAGELYARRVGQAPITGRSVNIDWPPVLHANAGLGYDLRLGNLADALAKNQVLLTSGGGPFADCVAAANNGTVSRQGSLKAMGGHCLIWDAGSNFASADGAVGEAARQIAELHGRLVVISPFASDSDYAQGRRLTPVLEWGADIPAGMLRSSTTHRVGLVANTDFAPEVGAYFGLEREQFPVWPFGHAWSVSPASHAETQVMLLENEAIRQTRGMALLPYLAVAVAVWMLGGTLLALIKRLPVFLPILPVVLINAILFSASVLSFFAWFVLLLLIAWIFAKRFGSFHTAMGSLVLIAASLVLDMLSGSRLMQQSLLGYSAIEGARYYGIGNEAMGAFIGASLVLAARLWPLLGAARWIILVILGMISVLLGSGGAKAGGLLVSLAAFGVLGFILRGGRWSTRIALALAGIVIAAMTLAAISDAVWGQGGHSHIGEAARRIHSGGLTEAWDIIARKLAVESRLAYHSAWACPLWGGLLCLWMLWRCRNPQTWEERALRTAGTVAITACVLFNDAGIIAGALCLIPIWCDVAIAQKSKKPLELHAQFQGQPSTGPVY